MLTPKEGGSARNWRASMAQDVIKGRRTEIDYMNGLVVDKGREVGVPTPVSSAVVDLMREVDARHAEARARAHRARAQARGELTPHRDQSDQRIGGSSLTRRLVKSTSMPRWST